MQPGQLFDNEFMLQKLLSQEEAGEVWRALEFNVGSVVQLHFLPKSRLSASRVKKRLHAQIKEWQISQKPGLVLPVRWNETPEGLIFLVSPHIEGIPPEHYAAQWIQESFATPQPKSDEQDIYLLAEKIVPSQILRHDEKRKEPEPPPNEEPDSYKSVLAAARSASAPELVKKLAKEQKFQRLFLIWNLCVAFGVLTAVFFFWEHIYPRPDTEPANIERENPKQEPVPDIDDIIKPLSP